MSVPTRARTTRRLLPPLLALASTLATVAALEGALRGLAWRQDRRVAAAFATRERAPLPAGTRVDVGDILVRSAHPNVVYELRPNVAEAWLCRTRLDTTERGFRNHEEHGSPGSRPTRIVGIGDSVMFGWGVNNDDVYMARLGELLGTSIPHRRWTVVNAATPGYNAVQAVASLEHRALELDPDIVVYGYCVNDMELPRFLLTGGTAAVTPRSHLWELLRTRRLRGSQSPEDALGQLVKLGRDQESLDPAKAPPEYAHMVGPVAFARAMDRLAALSRSRGFRVIALLHPPLPPDIETMLHARGFEVVHTEPYLRRYADAHGLETTVDPPLIVGRPCRGRGIDLHPSATAHALIAQALRDHLAARESL